MKEAKDKNLYCVILLTRHSEKGTIMDLKTGRWLPGMTAGVVAGFCLALNCVLTPSQFI